MKQQEDEEEIEVEEEEPQEGAVEQLDDGQEPVIDPSLLL